jgi:uncharacterized protein YndB with AHSA1/START domain
MFAIATIVIVVLIIAILIYAATKPNTFRIQRSANIKAPPGKVFVLINDHHNWAAWSPWEKLDPAMKKTFSGPVSGEGATFEWEGNSKAGAGRSEIIESSSPAKIVMKLDFLKPFKAHNTAEFTLEKKGSSTELTWAMYGPQPYMAKVMGTLIDCDGMVGKQFEEGLANLKALAEK